MFYQFNNTNLYYKRVDQGGKTVLLMHGFGADSKAIDCLFYFLKNRGYSVISIDFAGFGQSEEPKCAWSIYDYADSVESLLKQLEIAQIVGVGHSFGGRVGLILASRKVLSALVIINGAGLKPKRSLLYYARILTYKTAKALKIKWESAGSKDYKSLSKNMRATFVKVVNEHLDYLLPTIDIPTLILWGDRDMQTPLYMAKRLHKNIKNSTLFVFEGGHYSYIDSYNDTCLCMENFLCSLE